MGTTTKGLRYPEPTDRVNQGHVAIQNLASDVDARIPSQMVFASSAQQASVSVTSGAQTGSATVNWPTSRFTQAPLVQATLASGVSATAGATLRITAVSTTSVTVELRLPAVAGSTASYNVHLIGVQMLTGAAAG